MKWSRHYRLLRTCFFVTLGLYFIAVVSVIFSNVATANMDFFSKTLYILFMFIVVTLLTFSMVLLAPSFRDFLFRMLNIEKTELKRHEERREEAGSSEVTFLSVLKMNNLDVKICNLVARRNLTLAGFTLTALTFIIGFYKDNLASATTLVSSLLLAMFFFFLGSQMAHEAEYLWHIFLADIFQYGGVFTLMSSMTYFITQKLEGAFFLTIFPIILTFVMLAYLSKGIRNMHRFYERMKKEKT